VRKIASYTKLFYLTFYCGRLPTSPLVCYLCDLQMIQLVTLDQLPPLFLSVTTVLDTKHLLIDVGL